MVKRIINFVHKEWGNLHEAALLLGITALLAQIFGFIRDRMLAAHFGAGQQLDIYYAAFRVPDFLYDTLGSAVAITVLIPFIAEYAKKGNGELRKFMSAMFTAFMAAFVVICGIAFVMLPKIVPWLVPGFTPAEQAQNILVARILLLSPIFQGLSNLYGALVQASQRFFVYAISPALYNLGIICGIVFLAPHFGVIGVAWGVAFGALAQDLIMLPVLMRERLVPGVLFGRLKDVWRVITTSVPRTVALTSSHMATIAIIGIASHVEGGVAVFSFGMTLQSITFSIIGASYSVAAFPAFAKLWADNEYVKFREHMLAAARHIVFWSLPITALFIVLRAQIVRVVLGTGRFDWNATRLVAAALAIFVLSVAAQSLVNLVTRAFYAAGNSRIPLIINACSALLIIGSAYGFTWGFTNEPTFRYFIETLLRVDGIKGTSVLMLPLAYSFGMIVNVFVLLGYMDRMVRGVWKGLRRSFVHSLSVSVIMGFVAYHMLQWTVALFNERTLLGVLGQGLISGGVAVIAGVFFFSILNNEEYKETKTALHKKFWKQKPLVTEHETVVQ